MRTIVTMSDADVENLDRHCEREGISRAEAIRRAVGRYLREVGSTTEDAFGVWQDRADDGLAYEDRLRDEWGDRAGRP
jgi:hypothetical protein